MSRLRPVLDDLTYADLVAQARARIPVVAPGWTDHNPGDPGITLLELFAFLTEMLVYQADQLPPDRTDAFLRLLNGPDSTSTGDPDRDVRETLTGLRTPWRAASADDVVTLLTQVWPEAAPEGTGQRLARVRCVPSRDLTAATPDQPAPGHLSIVVVPTAAPDDPAGWPAAVSAQLRAGLHAWLEPRRLLGVRHHVLAPVYVPVAVTARLVLREDYAPAAVASSGVLTDAAIAAEAGRQAAAAVAAHLHPLTGGPDGAGWPFGRGVHASELYAVLDALPGVDFVEDVRFPDLAPERAISVDGEVTGARLAGHELVAVRVVSDDGRPGGFPVTWSRPGDGAR